MKKIGTVKAADEENATASVINPPVYVWVDPLDDAVEIRYFDGFVLPMFDIWVHQLDREDASDAAVVQALMYG